MTTTIIMKLTKININKNVELIASKNNLKIADEQMVQGIVLATTTRHTLLLGLESALLPGLVVAWKYIFQVQVMSRSIFISIRYT